MNVPGEVKRCASTVPLRMCTHSTHTCRSCVEDTRFQLDAKSSMKLDPLACGELAIAKGA
jgi:hypothetical protein